MTDSQFLDDIGRFNQMYRLEDNSKPTLLSVQRIRDFENILAEEVGEAKDIAKIYQGKLDAAKGDLSEEDRLEVLGEMSDWLGDIIVYCASEARRWGLPIQDILKIIMESNFSKLGEDGKPIIDDRGKVMKGPGYWKPEPKIREKLAQH